MESPGSAPPQPRDAAETSIAACKANAVGSRADVLVDAARGRAALPRKNGATPATRVDVLESFRRGGEIIVA